MPRKLFILLFTLLGYFSFNSASAGTVDRVKFGIPAIVKTKLLSQEPGLSRYRVVSNAGFAIHGQGMIGEVDVELAGQGSAAQMPGPRATETFLSGLKDVIYRAHRKTAKTPCTPRNQSVVIEIRYSETADAPDFLFKPVS